MPFHRLTRQQLLDLVWSKPMRDVGKDLGVSDVAVKKVCVRVEVPTPPQGHWNRIHASKPGFAKPDLPPRGFAASVDVTFGSHVHGGYHPGTNPEEPIPEPVFDSTIDEVRERARKAVGKLGASRDLKAPHPAIAQILREEDERRRKIVGMTYGREFYGPKFDKPGDARRIRLLDAIARGVSRGRVIVRMTARDRLGVTLVADDLSMNLDCVMTTKRAAKRGEANSQVLTLRLGPPEEGSRNEPWRQWFDGEDDTLEARLSEIAVDCLVGLEERWRERRLENWRWREEWRNREIEERRKARIEAERNERERQERLERERVERLLGEADALRRAQAIRAYVAEVERLQGEGRSPVDAAAFEKWKAWALAQADRIDPVTSGAFAKGIEEG